MKLISLISLTAIICGLRYKQDEFGPKQQFVMMLLCFAIVLVFGWYND